ncbi:hypothetical protein BTA51_25565 [Hahella sp. CCB-MM4]|uniref:hypothetical protein n=1 Tax=Hahella sp. (strain CCB-MM4) TaxID=1926491 RepID=UPI000B9BCB20|nr:hypothetical protein [Hahella sp. CCB-MM4]OZG70505.1 hypothetical protein BTA51_25565 [Hahella sp. CCB-MM4]
MIKNKFVSCTVLLLSVFFAIYIFYPALYGGFLLDDFPNLRGLSSVPAFNELTSLKDIFYFDLGDIGRPLSYASFYFQHQSWPDIPFDFKVVNFVIHILNSLLLYVFLASALKNTRYGSTPLAVVVSVVWMIHPMQISSVFYVVQRMTLLSAFFSLMFLVMYIHIRRSGSDKVTVRLLAELLVALLLLVLGILSKENAILSLGMVVALEMTVLRTEPVSLLIGRLRLCLIYLPVLLVVMAAVIGFDYLLKGYVQRDFGPVERMLTETRVLLDYLQSISLARAESFKFIFDNYPVSKGLFQPLETVFCLLFHIGSIGLAILIRKRLPVISLGILNFYIWHILESTIIPLELYFEHRNYLASIGVILIILCLVTDAFYVLRQKGHSIASYLVIFLAVVWAGNLAVTSSFLSRVWDNPLKLAIYIYNNNKGSNRAHAHVGMYLNNLGMTDAAARFYKETNEHFSDDPSKILLWLEIGCTKKDVEKPSLSVIENRLSQGKYYLETVRIIQELVNKELSGQCMVVQYDELLIMLDALKSNNNYQIWGAELSILESQVYEKVGEADKAISALEVALSYKERVDILLSLSQRKYLAGNILEAKKLYEKARVLCESKGQDCQYTHELETVQSLIFQTN